jgi:ribosomal protein S18 acetylase RimI-like enzyme
MSAVIKYCLNKASETEVAEHLLSCDASFVPPLSSRVNIYDYAVKLVRNAIRFEAWSGGTLVGLVAAYCNDHEKRIAFISNVSVLSEWSAKGIAARLINRCIKYAKLSGMLYIRIEVASNNMAAIRFYRKNGFVSDNKNQSSNSMFLYLREWEIK